MSSEEHLKDLRNSTLLIPVPRLILDQFVILIAFPQQQWFRKRASILRYTYIACLVNNIPASVSQRQFSRLKFCTKNNATHGIINGAGITQSYNK
jgi:hypothetical protein